MADLHSVLQDLLIVTSGAVVCALICNLLRLPTIIGFICAGIILGPYGLGFVSSIPGAEAIVELGVVLLLFSIGVECSTEMIKQYRKSFIVLGGLQVCLTTLLSAALLPFAWPKAILFGFLIALSSTAIVIKYLQDNREQASAHGTSVTGILLFQDFAVIAMTLAIPLMASGEEVKASVSGLQLLTYFLGFVGGVALLYVARKYILPYVLEKIIETRSRELFMLFIFVVCFGVAVGIEACGLSLGIGAFIAGLLISGSAFGLRTSAEILPLKDSILGLFFASVGTLINISFVWENLGLLLGLLLLVFIVKTVLITVIGMVANVPQKTSMVTAVYLFQMGEFAFVLGEMGNQYNLIADEELQYIFSLTAMTMMLTPFLIRFLPDQIHKIKFRNTRPGVVSQNKDLILDPESVFIVGFGHAGQGVASALASNKKPFVILDQNINLIRQAEKFGWKAKFCDATNVDELLHLGVEHAKLVVVCVSGVSATKIITERLKQIMGTRGRVIVRVQFERQAKELLAVLTESDIVDAESVSTQVLVERVLENEQVHTREVMA